MALKCLVCVNRISNRHRIVKFLHTKMAQRGSLIVFEGCDRSGKTTQCKKLVESLASDGYPIEFMRFPDRTTTIGKIIGEYLSQDTELDDRAIHLLFSANRWESVPKIMKLLHNGTTIIVDRYAYSGVAFTAAKPGFDFHWCKQPDVGLPKPDSVIYLTLSPEAAAMREDFGGERYEHTDFQIKVAAKFDLLKDPQWQIVDADKDVEMLHTELKDIVQQKINDDKIGKIERLWEEELSNCKLN